MATIETDATAQLQSEFTPRSRSLYRLSLEKYEVMIETGVFTKRDRFQLVEGLLVAKMTENPPHSSVSVTTAEELQALLPAGSAHTRREAIENPQPCQPP